ncbi:ATP-binding protein [Actibacterium sp. MT2.3-13A]|uniref:ATP-binding response regulator n=1 Tax=Actibacterium sp. MT2.3-13A TaxID=2828332 RepID=UPI0032C211F9
MSHTAQDSDPLSQAAAAFARRAWELLVIALAVLLVGLYVPDPLFGPVLAGIALTLAMLTLGMIWRHRRGTAQARAALHLARQFAGRDDAPGFVTDGDGRVTYRNAAARTRFGADGDGAQTLVRALGELFADPASVIYRILGRAAAQGAAREDVVTRHGHVRVAAHRIAGGMVFWRFDEMEDPGPARGIDGLGLPVLTVGRNDTVLFMNEAARGLIGGRVRTLGQAFGGPVPAGSGVVSLPGPDGAVAVQIVEFASGAGRREMLLLPQTGTGTGAATIDGPLFDALPVAMLQLAPDGRVHRANRLARDLLGWTGGEVNLSERVEGLGRSVRDWLGDVAAGRVANRSEVLRVARDDRELFLQVTLERIVQDGAVSLVAVLHDATKLKSLEAQFVQSQKMQAIGQLAGGVAHDFNNLLTAISGHCDLLLLRHDAGDPEYGDLMQIAQNANRAASLVGQLLAFSRKQTLRPELLDLRDILTDLTHLLNRLVGEKVSLVFSHDPGLTPIHADKRQLEQVIMNLVVNARDAMPEGGEIRIETALHHLDAELERDRAVVPPGDYVLVRVIDEGSGIPADKMDKIFEPFFTTKRTGEGTGLGLSTAYGIMKQSGGFIFADSAVGSGTCFTLYFPARDPAEDMPAARAGPRGEDAPEAAPAPLPDGGADGRAARDGPLPRADGRRPGEGVVLLVEDEAPVRAFASRALRLRGYTVLEADSAEQALETLRDGTIDVDVFVTDVVMPGMDGPTWVREALNDRPRTRVVFISGYAEETFGDAQAEIPNSVFLPKPFSLTQLTDTVQAQMI